MYGRVRNTVNEQPSSHPAVTESQESMLTTCIMMSQQSKSRLPGSAGWNVIQGRNDAARFCTVLHRAPRVLLQKGKTHPSDHTLPSYPKTVTLSMSVSGQATGTVVEVQPPQPAGNQFTTQMFVMEVVVDNGANKREIERMEFTVCIYYLEPY